MNTLPSVAGPQDLTSLKLRATQDPKAAVREAAKQAESLFMQQLLKSMRESAMLDGSLENQGSQLGRDLLDTQWATQLAGRPGGLGDAIARQLEQQMGGVLRATKANTPTASTPAAPATTELSAVQNARVPQQAAAFVQQHRAAAQAAAQTSGIPADFMLAQAAHETGWGRKDIRMADGSPSNNLFGIKAGAGWTGPVARITTTEYVDGQPRKMVQTFRAYASAAESFADYARLMTNSPRYAGVVAAGHDAQRFAQGLQQAGYATDPAYADKLGRVINTTLRVARSLAA